MAVDCKVIFENPDRVFCAGGNLAGTVEFTLTDKLKVKRLYIIIEGSGKCKWMGKTQENSSLLSTHSGQEQYMNSVADLIQKDTELQAGTHAHSFVCELPRGLPPSIKEKRGRIKYKIRVIFERSWRTNLKYDFDFQVVKPVDLNNFPELINPIRQEVVLHFQSILGKQKPFRVIAQIPRSGFLVGQCALVTVEIKNPTNYLVLLIKTALMKNVIYQCNEPSTEQLVEVSKIREIPCGRPFMKGNLKYEINFVIPETGPSSDSNFCRVLNVTYDLRVKVVIEAFPENPEIKIPIKIGSIPFRNESDV